MSVEKKAKEVTKDHKPNDPVEMERVNRLGGAVKWHGRRRLDGSPVPGQGAYRINGNLALSRAIGDAYEIPFVSSSPDVARFKLDSHEGGFIVVGSDGLWDVMESQDVVDYINYYKRVDEEECKENGAQSSFKETIAERLVGEALKLRTTDNVTVIVLWL
jgi:serine/threonine protein phosphatase PrpC